MAGVIKRTALGQDVEDEGGAPAMLGTVLLTLQSAGHRPGGSVCCHEKKSLKYGVGV